MLIINGLYYRLISDCFRLLPIRFRYLSDLFPICFRIITDTRNEDKVLCIKRNKKELFYQCKYTTDKHLRQGNRRINNMPLCIYATFNSL
jgi:hypothetical protein